MASGNWVPKVAVTPTWIFSQLAVSPFSSLRLILPFSVYQRTRESKKYMLLPDRGTDKLIFAIAKAKRKKNNKNKLIQNNNKCGPDGGWKIQIHTFIHNNQQQARAYTRQNKPINKRERKATSLLRRLLHILHQCRLTMT